MCAYETRTRAHGIGGNGSHRTRARDLTGPVRSCDCVRAPAEAEDDEDEDENEEEADADADADVRGKPLHHSHSRPSRPLLSDINIRKHESIADHTFDPFQTKSATFD